MFSTNAHYGNDIVLAAYAGLAEPLFAPTIPGYVQPWLGDETPPGGSRPGVPTFVWGPAARARRRRTGETNHTIIGAPWLYLLELERAGTIPLPPLHPDQLPDAEPGGRTLYFPQHGLAGELAARRRAEGLGSDAAHVTVALTHEQAAAPGTRAAYESVGARVLDLGPATAPVGSIEPFFLQRLLHLVRVHREVRTDTVGAFALFAHAAGAPVTVADGTDASRLSHACERELGTRELMPAQELRAIFDWTSHA